MENVKNNYKNLLLDYSEAAQVFEETGRAKLLSFAWGSWSGSSVHSLSITLWKNCWSFKTSLALKVY